MLSKIRLTLVLLIIGFIIEGAIGAYTLLSGSSSLPYAALILFLGPFITLAGLLVLWAGRRQWNDLISRDFRHAHRVFGLSVVALVFAVLPIGWYTYQPAAVIPWWVYWGFGAAVVFAFLLTFATYVLLAFPLTSVVGKGVLTLALAGAGVLSFLIGIAVALEFGAILLLVQTHSLAVMALNSPIAGLESYFAVVYALLIIGYLDAYRLTPPSVPNVPRVTPPAPVEPPLAVPTPVADHS